MRRSCRPQNLQSFHSDKSRRVGDRAYTARWLVNACSRSWRRLCQRIPKFIPTHRFLRGRRLQTLLRREMRLPALSGHRFGNRRPTLPRAAAHPGAVQAHSPEYEPRPRDGRRQIHARNGHRPGLLPLRRAFARAHLATVPRLKMGRSKRVRGRERQKNRWPRDGS